LFATVALTAAREGCLACVATGAPGVPTFVMGDQVLLLMPDWLL
jgi:hypothetical protein